MKKIVLSLIISSVCLFLLFGCNELLNNDNLNLKSDTGFSFVFSDGTQLTKNNIQYYDSSSHLLFLKEELDLTKVTSTFAVLVGNDTIYNGIIFPSVLSSLPQAPIYISDYSLYGPKIIQIGCHIDSLDFRNDERIINALQSENLLHHGLQVTINNIEVSSVGDHSAVDCSITVKNNDPINYYILDPVKMGGLNFNYFTGGIHFVNTETGTGSFIRWSVSNPHWENITMGDFSILKSGEQVEYTFQSSDYYKMEPGIYRAVFGFCGTKHRTPDFELNQQGGRIWVGAVVATVDNVVVN